MSFQTLPGRFIQGRPAVLANGARLDVFARSVENELVHRWSPDGEAWPEWESFPGLVLRSDPSVATHGTRDRLTFYVFATSIEDTGVHYKHFFGEWGQWNTLGGSFRAQPRAVMRGPSRVDVFVRGEDNALYHNWIDNAGLWDESAGRWESLGGVLASDPEVVVGKDNSLHVFVRGVDDGLHHIWYDAAGWHPWQRIAGPITAPPVAFHVPLDPVHGLGGSIFLFCKNGDANVFALRLDDGATSPRPIDSRGLTGTAVGPLSAVSWWAGRLDVFARSGTNQLLHAWAQESTGSGLGFHPWEPMEPNSGDPVAVSGNYTWLDVFANNGLTLARTYWRGAGWLPRP